MGDLGDVLAEALFSQGGLQALHHGDQVVPVKPPTFVGENLHAYGEPFDQRLERVPLGGIALQHVGQGPHRGFSRPRGACPSRRSNGNLPPSDRQGR